MVASFHFSLVAGLDEPWLMFPGSFVGPSTFFTLSGYLITSILLAERERTGGISSSGFWGRRFRRLLPSSTVGVLIVVAMMLVWPDIWGNFSGSDVAASVAGVMNWHSIALADAGEAFRLLGPLGVYWSLSLEEQFYIIMFALLVFSLGRGEARMRWFVGLLVAVWLASVASLWFVVSTPQRELFGTDTRASEAVVGCLLAVWVHHRGMPTNRFTKNIGWISFLVALWVWLFVRETDPWIVSWGLPAFAFVSAGMIVGLSQPTRFAKVFSTAPLVLLGRISYPAYIIHWPVALALSSARLDMNGAPLILLRFAVALGIAWVMYEYIEKPLKDLRAIRLPNGLVLWLVLGGSATLVTVAIAGWGWP